MSTPGDYPSGLIQWFKADAITGLTDGNAVSTWVDASPSALNAAQSSAGSKPTYKTGILNGLPVVRFDGGDYMTSLASSSDGTQTIIAVVKSTNGAAVGTIRGGELWAGTSATGGLQFRIEGTTDSNHLRFVKEGVADIGQGTVAVTPNAWHVVTGTWDDPSNAYAFTSDGVSAGGGSSTVNLIAGRKSTIGANGSPASGGPTEFFTGDIAEIAVWSRVLTSTERDAVIAGLQSKWIPAGPTTTVGAPVSVGLGFAAKAVVTTTLAMGATVGLGFAATPATTVAAPVNAGLSFAAVTVEAGTTTVAAPVTAGLGFAARTVVSTTLDAPVNAGLSFEATRLEPTTLAMPVTVGLDFAASTGGATTLDAPVNAGLSFEASGGDIIVPPVADTDPDATLLDLDTDEDDVEIIQPLALPPAGFTERPIMRRSVIVPDLSAYPKDPISGQPHLTDAEYDAFPVIEEEVGVPHLIFPNYVSANDVTYHRGVPLQGLRFLRREPFGDADCDATIPALTSMDLHPDLVGTQHSYTRPRANMEFILRRSDGSMRRLWSGYVFTRSLGNDGRQPTMNLHGLGSMYMADSTRNRPIVSDNPLDYGYEIPRALNTVTSRRYKVIPPVTTGILTRERGAWSDSPMGFALDGLAKCWTDDGRQWTIAKVVGSRRQYEMRLKKTAPEWTFTNGARGVYVDLEEDDNGRNVVFGHGVNADGGVWYNTKYPDNGGVIRLPLAADPRTQHWLYDDDGNITGPNPEYNVNILPREDDVDFGQNSKAIGARSAQQIVDRESVPSFVGRITVETDPREGWRGDIQAGDKLTLIGYQGRDLILHVSDVEVSLDGSMPVTLTVDERSRDAMTVAQIRDRNKDARRDPALRPGNPNRRSRLEVDQIVPFDSESPAGRVPAWSVQGGQWNIKSIPFATAGRIAKVHFETGSPMAAGLFAFRPSVAHLNSLIGNPLTQDDPLKANMNTLEGTFGLCAFWGQQGQRMGYSPGREDASDPFTGDFDEATGFDYVAQANARLYLAVFTAADTTVSGRCYPALVV